MIDSLRLINFQSYKKAIFNFSKGLNVIFGNSDAGKSTIIRAIKLIVSNRPTGDEYRRHETNRTSVSAKSNGSVIHRKRSDSINEYIVNSSKFKALRTNVPEEVTKALNISGINIQEQHEVYFLIDQSPGQISKKLNEVAGLDIMDKVIKRTNREIQSNKRDITGKKELLKEAEEKIKKLKWTKIAEGELSSIEKLQKSMEEIEIKISKLHKIIKQIHLLTEEKKIFVSDSFISELNILIDSQNELDYKYIKINRLDYIIRELDNLKNKKENIHVIDISALKKQKILIDSEQSNINKLKNIIEEIEFKRAQYKQIDNMISESHKKIEKELKRLGVCPTCNQKYKGDEK